MKKLEHIKNIQSGEVTRVAGKWTKSGLLDGLSSPDVTMTNMALLLEGEAKQLLNEEMGEFKYNEVDGDLIFLAKKGCFDVITHGCNCRSIMSADRKSVV